MQVLALDAALVGAGALAAFTDEVVLWFHTVFVLLTYAALVLPLRPMLWRAALWVPIVIVLILRAAAIGTTTYSELIEIPLLSAILILVFVGARHRGRTVDELRTAQAELEARSRAERVELERRLARAQQLDAFGQLSLGIVHDFNNVLTALLGGVEQLLDELAGRASRDVAQELLDELQRARSLMDELAGYVRAPAAGVMWSDLGDTVEYLRPMLLRLTRMDASLDLDLRARSAIVPLSRSQVDQIVMNLVLNALDALGPYGRIRIETHDSHRVMPIAEGGDEQGPAPGVALTIVDDGVGIAPDVLEQVFDPGFTTKGDGRNLGMGMASVRRIVEGAGGSIEIDSAPELGTSVRIWLPVISAEPQDDQRVAITDALPPTGTETILLAEDDGPVRNRVAGILRSAGYAVVACVDGDEATAVAVDLRPDLLVTDVSMPGRGGVELTHELRWRHPGTPVVLISGIAGDRVLEDVDPPAAMIQKPFTRSELLHAVRRVLDHPDDEGLPGGDG